MVTSNLLEVNQVFVLWPFYIYDCSLDYFIKPYTYIDWYLSHLTEVVKQIPYDFRYVLTPTWLGLQPYSVFSPSSAHGLADPFPSHYNTFPTTSHLLPLFKPFFIPKWILGGSQKACRGVKKGVLTPKCRNLFWLSFLNFLFLHIL